MANEDNNPAATVQVKISPDNMQASVIIPDDTPRQDVSSDIILLALNEAGVEESLIDPDAIADFLTYGDDDDELHIKGKPAVHGEATKFIPLVDTDSFHAPRIDEKGVADHHAVNDYLIVEPGTPLLERVAATEGRSGQDVKGKEIKAKPGTDTRFAKKLEGVCVDPKNENILVADVKGHPVFVDEGVRVDTILKVEDVNLKSGDIEFDGSVYISGDVFAGMRVEATGDIHVKGIVNNATLTAGADINANGIAGKETESKDSDSESEEQSLPTLKAKGNVVVKYANLANIKAGGDIIAKDYLFHCNVKSKGDVLLGQSGGKGLLVGGHCQSENNVVANELGNDTNIVTHVVVGKETDLHRRHNKKKAELATRLKESTALTGILKKIVDSGKTAKLGEVTLNKATKIRNTIDHLAQIICQLNDDLKELEVELKALGDLSVDVKRKLYPNVVLTISGAVKKAEQPAGPALFRNLDATVQQISD